MMRKELYLIFISLFLTATVWSQQVLRDVVSIQGNSAQLTLGDHSYTVQQCIGQSSPISSFSTSRFLVHQGFLQPLLRAEVTAASLELELVVYPNPTSQVVHIETDLSSQFPLEVEVFDLRGRLIIAQKEKENQTFKI